MLNARLAAGIVQGRCNRFTQTETAVHLLQKQNTTIRGNITTVEIGFNNTSI